jgi:hypothetical protein
MTKTRAVLMTALAVASAQAFEIEKAAGGARFKRDAGVPVVEIGAIAYAVSEIPPGALKLEFAGDLEGHKEFQGKLDKGEPMAESEVQQVLEAYFRHTAIDFDSIKLRALKAGQPTYAVWCGEWFIVCLEGKGAAGTLVQFEANGRNRQGGMTGYQPQTLLIRKRSGAAGPAPAPASAASAP